jgi:hypothetical protein
LAVRPNFCPIVAHVSVATEVYVCTQVGAAVEEVVVLVRVDVELVVDVEPPLGMQIDVPTQISLQFKKVLAARIASPLSPYFLPIEAQVSVATLV